LNGVDEKCFVFFGGVRFGACDEKKQLWGEIAFSVTCYVRRVKRGF
jgi:hypothetical protein